MGRQYTRNEMEDKCKEALKNPNTFYAQGFVNYQGICPDAGVPYTEVVAKFLCNNLTQYVAGIKKISRKSSYYTPTHDGQHDPTSNREEELIAMKMFNASTAGTVYTGIGKILDYQTPLKSRQTDKAGKIDLLSFDGNTLRLLELKKPTSKETMLRCVLEGFTYLKTVDEQKLISNFNEKDGVNIPDDTPVKASPLVFVNSRPHKDFLGDSPHLKLLMDLLDSQPFFIEKKGQDFVVIP